MYATVSESIETVERSETDLLQERRDLAVEFIFCLMLIEVLSQIPFYPGRIDFLTYIKNVVFKHFKCRKGIQNEPNAADIHIIVDLYAEVIGVLARSPYMSVMKRFMIELKKLRAKEPGPHITQHYVVKNEVKELVCYASIKNIFFAKFALFFRNVSITFKESCHVGLGMICFVQVSLYGLLAELYWHSTLYIIISSLVLGQDDPVGGSSTTATSVPGNKVILSAQCPRMEQLGVVPLSYSYRPHIDAMKCNGGIPPTRSTLSEINDAHVEYLFSRREVQQLLFQHLLPSLHNMELIDPNVSPPSNLLSSH
ncbi:unnamed protein product [Xylocopa violacea]|uniref:Cell morphogenesis protein N-terminal domain-containing protein n=1 Tax=Xylocopa violacea TaxID=135666 RepID=A0ABP1NKN4_XYLVO